MQYKQNPRNPFILIQSKLSKPYGSENLGWGKTTNSSLWAVWGTCAFTCFRLHSQQGGIKRVKNKLLKVTVVAMATINFAKKHCET